jgi:phage-related protein
VHAQPVKRILWAGSSKEDVKAFPTVARREAGFQLNKIQHGDDPDDWKPMTTIGAGVREIRIRDAVDAFRVVYVARFGDAIHVLHAFQKKTPKTSRQDLELAQIRYKSILR